MKKLTSLFLALLVCVIALSSCTVSLPYSVEKEDPMGLAKFFDTEGFSVMILVDDQEVDEFADGFGIRSKSIYCIIGVCPNDGEDVDEMGIFVYCNSIDLAKALKNDLEDFLDTDDGVEFEDEISNLIIKRDGKRVFIGCKSTWDDAQ